MRRRVITDAGSTGALCVASYATKDCAPRRRRGEHTRSWFAAAFGPSSAGGSQGVAATAHAPRASSTLVLSITKWMIVQPWTPPFYNMLYSAASPTIVQDMLLVAWNPSTFSAYPRWRRSSHVSTLVSRRGT